MRTKTWQIPFFGPTRPPWLILMIVGVVLLILGFATLGTPAAVAFCSAALAVFVLAWPYRLRR